MHSIQAACRWAKYLLLRGHKAGKEPGILISKNRGGKQYWWVIYDCPGETKKFTREEKTQIRRILKASGRALVYVVVSFDGKFVASNAAHVLRAQRLDPDKGGIPW